MNSNRNLVRRTRRLVPQILGAALLLLWAERAAAQPFGAWMTLVGSPTNNKYIEVPSNASLTPISTLTFEAWVSLRDALNGGCSSIFGKGYQSSYWVGVCGTTLRSYLAGTASLKDGGVVPMNKWTHIAVTYDGANRRHYINGELAGTFAQAGLLPTNGSAFRIGSDVNFSPSPTGSIDEVRLWNVARTEAQIRSTINVALTTAQPGLVSVWSLNGSGADALGVNNGMNVGGAAFITFPVAVGCAPAASSLCLNGRFAVSGEWRTTSGTTGPMTPAVFSADSGNLWFFSSANWEILVKTINACSLNDRYWVFSASTTNVFYRMEVLDIRAGVQKIYFNYPGPPAPAVTDTDAFATCP